MADFSNWAALCLVLCMTHSRILTAQTGWHPQLRLEAGKEILTELRAVAVSAQAEYRGQKLRAYVFFCGHEGLGPTGYPDFGIFVDNMRDLFPESEISQFQGPDLSRAARHDNVVDLNIRVGPRKESTSTRLIYQSGVAFDTGFEPQGHFETNVQETRKATLAWREFVRRMSDGFDDGEAVVGGNLFSNKLTVRFTGNGLGAQLKDLMDFCCK